MIMKPVFYMLFVLAIAMVVGCGPRSSDVERIGVSNPAQSTESETSRKTTRTTTKEVTLPGTNKITPTQVQIRLPKVLGQSSGDIKRLESRISQLENTVRDLNRTVSDQKRTVSDLKRTVGNSRFDPRSLQSDVRALKSDVQDLKRKLR